MFWVRKHKFFRLLLNNTYYTQLRAAGSNEQIIVRRSMALVHGHKAIDETSRRKRSSYFRSVNIFITFRMNCVITQFQVQFRSKETTKLTQKF